MQRFCETIENSLNIYKALAKRRQGGLAEGYASKEKKNGSAYIREKHHIILSAFSFCPDCRIAFCSELWKNILTAQVKVFELFRTSQLCCTSPVAYHPRRDLFLFLLLQPMATTWQKKPKATKICPFHKYLPVVWTPSDRSVW